MRSNEVLDLSGGPLRYAGWSSCFRREAGSYGKDTRGIIRVHWFDKVEMFSFCRPEEAAQEDRKSTRLNSSHANISYAVFCLKKKISLVRDHRPTNTSARAPIPKPQPRAAPSDTLAPLRVHGSDSMLSSNLDDG